MCRRFLAEGRERGERLLFVAADPNIEAYRELAQTFSDDLEVASIAEVYGATGVVDAVAQRQTFATVLTGALNDGYTGIRVAASNSTLVRDPERLEAWMRWESVADRFMSTNNVTGLCGFDRQVVEIDTLRHLASLHPLSSATAPIPQYRLFAADGTLRLEGDVDDLALAHLQRALAVLPYGTQIRVDLTHARVRNKALRETLESIAAGPVPAGSR